MKRQLTINVLIFVFTLVTIGNLFLDASAQQVFATNKYYKAKVVNVLENTTIESNGLKQPYQKLELQILNGDNLGDRIEIDHGGLFNIAESQRVKKGDILVLSTLPGPDGNEILVISDRYRTDSVIILLIMFVFVAFLTAGKRALSAILGLLFSTLIIVNFLVPQILVGNNPILVSYTAVFMIAIVSLYLAHGFNINTSLALVSTLITLFISIILSNFAVRITDLTGAGTEESMFLQLNQNIDVNLKGLLLGGIILGVLGVLDDITTAQTSVVDEIKKANPRLTLAEIYTRGANVGKEHITSLINTLFLAYSGAALPLFLLFKINNQQPFWVTFNSEFIVEEVVRTLVGSISLIIAVPLSTYIAAYYYKKIVKI